jgi:hypothetical protein
MMRLVIGLGLALLGGGAAAQEAWSFRCPEDGTVVRFVGLTLRYQGPGEAPVLCRIGGQTTPWVLGAAGNQDPVGRAMQATLSGFFPARPGARAGLPPRDPSGAGGAELSFPGYEAMEVAGQSYQAARIDFTYRRSAERTQRQRLWIDAATGALLRVVVEDTERPQAIDAQAISITRP